MIQRYFVLLILFLCLMIYSCSTNVNELSSTSIENMKLKDYVQYECYFKSKSQVEGTDSTFIELVLKIKDVDGLTSPLIKYSGSYDQYSEGFDYFFDDFKNDIHLVFNNGNVHWKLSEFLFEPSQGFFPYETFVLGFLVPSDILNEHYYLEVYDVFYYNDVVQLDINFKNNYEATF